MPNVNCQHNPDTQWTGTEALEHFFECQTLKERQAQLLQWRDAARKWWDHQELVASGRTQVTVQGYHRDGECPPQDPAEPFIAVEPADLCVHVVLGGSSITLADRDPLDPVVLETITPTEKAVARALLFCAVNELED
jgi:hypothetical protein